MRERKPDVISDLWYKNAVIYNCDVRTYLDAGLNNLTTYYYVVSAQNDAGEGPNSAQVTATPGILSRVGWVASALSTESGGSAARAIDGDITTRWSAV